MSVERANVAVENLIADHIAASFRQETPSASRETTAAQIRSRITDRFQIGALGPEQDNTPPAIQLLRANLINAFAFLPPQSAKPSQDRTEQLALLQASAQELHRTGVSSGPTRGTPLHVDLLLERQQLVVKNEFTEGFGRFETWLVAVAVLALVLIQAIDYLWAVPILALSIGRSWHLDHQCRKRRTRIAEIDAIIQPAVKKSHV